jgi:hypothetical protein
MRLEEEKNKNFALSASMRVIPCYIKCHRENEDLTGLSSGIYYANIYRVTLSTFACVPSLDRLAFSKYTQYQIKIVTNDRQNKNKSLLRSY